MQRNTLYAMNKYNRPIFIPRRNVFDSGGEADLSILPPKGGFNFAGSFKMPNINQGLTGNALSGLQKQNQAIGMANAFSLGAKGGAASGLASGFAGAGMLAGGVGTMLGNAVGGAIAGDYELGGVGEVANLVQSVNTGNPLIDGVKNFAAGALSGTISRAFGTSVNEAQKAAVEEGIKQNENFVSNAESFDAVEGPKAVVTDTDVAKGGWFGGGAKADRINNDLKERMIAARSFANRSVDNNVFNLQSDQLNDALANYAAFGGPIDIDPSTAIGYSLYTDKFIKDKQKESRMTNMFAGTPDIFGFGGGIYTKGANYEQPQDNTRVVGSIVLPIERQQNFSDEQYFWNAGKEYPAGLWKHKDGTFHTTGAYGKDIQLTQEEADAIIRNNMLLERQEKLKRAMGEKQYANGGYIVGNTYDVDEQEANRLKSLGYEFTIIG